MHRRAVGEEHAAPEERRPAPLPPPRPPRAAPRAPGARPHRLSATTSSRCAMLALASSRPSSFRRAAARRPRRALRRPRGSARSASRAEAPLRRRTARAARRTRASTSRGSRRSARSAPRRSTPPRAPRRAATGRARGAPSAVQRPVYPPPTIATSTSRSPCNGGRSTRSPSWASASSIHHGSAAPGATVGSHAQKCDATWSAGASRIPSGATSSLRLKNVAVLQRAQQP